MSGRRWSRANVSLRRRWAFASARKSAKLSASAASPRCSPRFSSGLPEGRARGERGRTLGQLKLFADEARSGSWQMPSIDLAIPDRSPLPKADIRKVMLPLGPVAVFGASNFPLAYSTAGGDTASALAVGCPVIVKSHPMHAGTSFMVASAIVNAVHRTKMPKGIFAHLNSRDHRIGQQLATHPMVKAIGFTGSEKGGRALFDLAAQR
ncbi:MAG: aldehyde dehydrogenase family protein, partial [Rhodobacteraceae bacterium]|nr:aldehyde dehydrogenase family protein [Paracoccaceae bacterium]